MKYFYLIKFFNYLIVLCGLFFSSPIVNAQVLNPGIYDWEGFTAGEVHAISTNTTPATWEIGNGFTAIATGNGNGSQMRVLIANSLATNALRYDGLAGATLNSAILKSTSGVDFGIKQFNIWPTQNETQMIEVYVKRDGVTVDTIRAYYQPTTPIHKITISSSDYPFLANMDELEIFDFNVGVVLDDIEVMLNQAPIAMDDEVSVTEDTPATGNVLTNDSDPEGNALTASLVTAPVNGTVVLNADGSFTYTPNSNYNGPDSLIYQVCDNGSPSLCDTALVRFSVEAINDDPTFTGLPSSITIDEDEYFAHLRNALSDGVFADIDAGSNDVSLTLHVDKGIIMFAANGGISVTISGNGSPTAIIRGTAAAIESYLNISTNIVYRPLENATDPVTFSLSANDNGHTGTGGGGDVALGSFIININAINDAPEAVDDTVTTTENTPVRGNVLTNDTDLEGDALTASLVTAPANGTVVLNADGSFIYTPNSNYSGLDSLIYQVCDNGAPSLCDTATLRFTVSAGNPSITNVNASTVDGLYKIGDQINVTISFNQAVTVDVTGGIPTLKLQTGAVSRDAAYTSGSGSNTLTFVYVVQAGDNTPDLEYVSTAALVLNGSIIRNTTGLDVALTLPQPGGSNSLAGQRNIAVDGVAPVSTTVILPANGYYRAGDVLRFGVKFDENVTVSTFAFTPSLTVVIGDITVHASYVSGSGTDEIFFSYTVIPGENDLDGIGLQGTIRNNVAITDAAGNEAVATLNNIPSTAGILVNTMQPNVALSTGASSPVSAPFTVTAIFSEAVTGFTLGDIIANNATLSSLQTNDNISYSFLVMPTVGGMVQVSIPADVAANIGSNGNSASNTLSLQYTTTITGVTLEDGSFVYDGTAKSLAITGTLPTGTTVSYENNSRTDVGTQEVTATISGGNYEPLVLKANLTITKAAIVGITLEDGSFVYDGTAKSLAIAGTLPAGTSVSYENNSRTDVGTQEVTATISGANYTDLVLTANLTVIKAVITGVTLEDGSFVYDGTAKSLAIAGTLPTGTTVSYENNSRTDVGTQEVTATVSGGNYETLVLTANLTVTKAVITGVTLEDGSFVYDGMAKSLMIAGTLPTGTTVSSENNSRRDVGTQEVRITVSGSNYTDLVLTANLTISKAVITGVTLEDGSFVYDGTAKSLAIAGTLPTGTTVSYENNSRTDVGTQEVRATISGSNYNDLVLTANLTITKASIDDVSDITFVDGSFVYDGTAKSLAIAGTLPTGTTVSYENNSRTDVGTQEVTATVSGGNYEPLVLKANLTVARAAIVGITLEDGSFVYDGTAKSLAIAGTLPTGTTVSYENNSRINVGIQEVTATISGANYNDLVLTANLTITKASIDDVSDITFVDGSFVYDGTAKSLAIAGTLPTGTTVSYENNSRTDVGTQEVTATISGGNYETLVLTANLTITRAVITGVTLEDGSFVYDGTAKSLAISGTLPTGTTVSYENNSRINVGTQEVTATISGANYNDLVLTANLTITKASIDDVSDITFVDGSFVYDGTAKSLAIAGTLPTGTAVSYENNSRTDVGTQEVRATISGANYNDLVLTANLTITKASIDDVSDITFVDGSFVYDGTAKSLAIAGTLPTGTAVSYENNSRTDVGTQEVTATISGGNYNDLVLTANLTITKAVIRGITLEDGSFVYDGAAKSLAIAGTLPTGTTVSYKNNSRTDVGTQEVTATISGGNYNDLVLTAKLTITKASIDDVSDITFVDGSFVYDGTAKSLVISGTLPAGTTVSYENNSRTDVGTQEVTATISGANYTQLILKATLHIRPVERRIDFEELSEKTFGDSDFDLRATANSGEAISYSSSSTEVATVSADGRIHIVAAGETIITATVPENANYNNKPVVSRKLIVRKALQQISFTELGEIARDVGSIPLIVSASSSLPVRLEVSDPQVATISGTMLNVLRLGTVMITAYQEGDSNYEAANPISITVRVADQAANLPIKVHKALSPNGDGINDFLMIEGVKDYPDNRLIIADRNGMEIIEIKGYNNEDKVFRGLGPGNNPIPPGTYFYLLEVKVNESWKYEKGYFIVRY